MRDTTMAQLWPIPKVFQGLFIVVVLAAVSVTAWPQVGAMLPADPANQMSCCTVDCGASLEQSLCARADASFPAPQEVDYDVLIGAAALPLVIGVAAALATPGRSKLGRVWYGTVFVALSMAAWVAMKAVGLLSPSGSLPDTSIGGTYIVASSTIAGVGIMVTLVAIDAWWQRRRYTGLRAWSLLVLEMAFMVLIFSSIVVNARSSFDPGSAIWAIMPFILAIGAVVAVTFVVFFRRTIHLSAKFSGLLLMIVIFGGYFGGQFVAVLFGPDAYDVAQVTAVAGAVLSYAVGAWAIGLKPPAIES